MASKIVVIGGVNGQFLEVFKKVAGLHAKNNFSFAIVVGDLFADPQTATPEDEKSEANLIAGNVEIPLPIYFALGSKSLPEKVVQKLDASGGELCSNLYFLGKRSTLKTSEGVRIVALGGSLDPNVAAGASKDKYPPYYGESDARALKGANTADILVTSEWPAEIQTGSKVEFKIDSEVKPPEQQCIADLCSAVKPRYHFSNSSTAFYEREPFFHPPSDDAGDGYRITRFISLASYGNPSKAKWIYAFSIDPTAAPPVAIPPGTTASPLSFAGKKRPRPTQETSYRFATDEGHRKRDNKRQRAGPPSQSECFFCLSNPSVASHMITSIAEEAYIATAKGPLTTATTFAPELKLACHMLIIPLSHSPTLAAVEESSRKQTFDDMERYRRALQKFVAETSKDKLGAVTWEVSRSGGVHTHWQFLPVPAGLIKHGLVEAAFKVQAENQKYPKFEKKDVGDGYEEGTDFFRLKIWCPAADGSNPEGAETSLMLPLDESFRFDLQFGRRVLAKLLELENRMDWRECAQTHEDEVGDAEAFKAAFKPYDLMEA
ncbi:Cwf19-like protein domain-2 [Macrophomina phaseolina MS6]|uniref:Cwf19-like protein domain-2 n=1 Tax=Macrophomina phaseolina (strain MS6) TaxID=1126212 RepID=K2RYM3_MACPH|nr:Cwf19-like protein domain-2 [Macrophomina phaseolina MS6]